MFIKILSLQAKMVNRVLKSIPTIKSSLPERAFFVFSSDINNDFTTITVNQGYFCLRFDVPCVVKEGGTCTIPQDVLLRVFSTMRGDISIDAKTEAVIISNSEEYSIQLPKMLVPDIPQPDCQKLICTFQKSQMNFLQVLNKCKLQSTKCEVSFGQSGFLQGADGYHIIQYGYRTANDMVYSILPMILPMMHVLFSEGCEVWKGEWTLNFKNKAAILSVHLLPTAIPVSFSIPKADVVTISVAEMKQALSRISPVSTHKGKLSSATSVKMETVEKTLVFTVDSDNYFGSINTLYTQSVAIACSGELPTALYVNLDYLNDVLSAASATELKLIPEGINICNFISGAMSSRVGLMQKPRKENVA